MNPSKRFGIAVVLLIVGLVAFSGWMAAGKRPPKEPMTAFAESVDLSTFDNLAVHTDGRIKSFASFAHERMGWVMGPRRYRQQTPSFTYLDMMFRPEVYAHADVVYVKNKNLRADIRDAFEGSDTYAQDPSRYKQRMDDFLKWGLTSDDILGELKVRDRLNRLETDLMRSAKFVQALRGAQNVKFYSSLSHNLTMVPPPDGDDQKPWLSLATANDGHGHFPEGSVPSELMNAWISFEAAWKQQDASGVMAAAGVLIEGLPELQPHIYPDAAKLSWESWYFHGGNMNWIWMIYLLSVVLLLLHLVYRWKAAGRLGLATFGVAFLFQTAAVGLRWWVSGRWPNSNMFEAVTTSAWMGGAAALAFEWYGRRTQMAKLFALTSGGASMVALMCAHYLPLQLNPNIGNMMPVLHDLWLYIHTNVIIWSYILIFMAAISGLLYLIHRACGAQAESLRMAGATFASTQMVSAGGTVGGSGGLGSGSNESEATGMGPVLDGVTMALMKLSFVMLWAGLVMGAIWADHSWGRPWGWDPKEVFALCTFIIFAVLVHVRWKARDKGIWTAILAVIGAVVMLFNWIVINFFISGLHSYA